MAERFHTPALDAAILAHPEYAARSRLPAGKFADWIEGQQRAHPAWRKRAALASNLLAVEVADNGGERRDIDLAHEAGALAAAANMANLRKSIPHRFTYRDMYQIFGRAQFLTERW